VQSSAARRSGVEPAPGFWFFSTFHDSKTQGEFVMKLRSIAILAAASASLAACGGGGANNAAAANNSAEALPPVDSNVSDLNSTGSTDLNASNAAATNAAASSNSAATNSSGNAL
jgi:hypothetical protein